MRLYNNDISTADKWPGPSAMTRPALDLMLDSMRLVGLEIDMVVTPALAQTFASAWTQAVRKNSSDKREPGAFTKLISLGLDVEKTFSHLRPTMDELLYCRAVDAYLTYVSRLAALVFRANPACLKSEKKVDLEFVLDYPTMDGLVTALAEQTAHSLSFKSLSELNDVFERRLGLPLFVEDADMMEGIRAVETRNLLVHGRGIASGSFVRRAIALKLKADERIKVDPNMLLTDLYFLLKAGVDLDARAVAKHRLQVETTVPDEQSALVEAVKTRWELVADTVRKSRPAQITS